MSIELINIRKSFGNAEILKGVSAQFGAGKVNCVIGASGSGKSVLMKCMVGIHKPDAGKILYDNLDFVPLTADEKKPTRRQIGMLFQGSALFDSMTVEENVAFPIKMFENTQSPAETLARVNHALERVGLAGSNHKFAGELSGGMMKRVGIARAIILNPKYLYCDEPNSGLDPLTAQKIDELIQEITVEYNTTTIVNTHDMNSVMEIGDYILFLHKGEKCWEGNKKDILTTDNEILNNFVFSTVFLKDFKQKQL